MKDSPSNTVAIICLHSPTRSEMLAKKIAEFVGADVQFVPIAALELTGLHALPGHIAPGACIIADAETLAHAAASNGSGGKWLGRLRESGRHMFIYGFQSTDQHSEVLREVSSAGFLSVRPLERSGEEFVVVDGRREWCAQLSGRSLGATDRGREAVFVEGENSAERTVLIRAGDKPFFVRIDCGKSDMFLVASSELADLEEGVSDEASPLPWFSRLVPLMIFLRRVLGRRAWHNDHPRACFIIDDPLLKRRYGFLEYGRLMDAMRRNRFSTSIAFIPWNYRRSRKETAELFAASAGMASVCVHGCDHTKAEFGTTNAEVLRGKARMALERMRAHQRLSGVPFDEVMVFPQGVFSSEAPRSLEACGYLAAVNTSLCPSNMPGTLVLRNVLDVVLTRFGGVPLFSRRYPNDAGEFAFDLFLGKPALAVAHHGDFRHGYEALETFVQDLHAVEARLQWTDLHTICSRTCLRRVIGDGEVQVRFYTRHFYLMNSETQPQKYLLSRWSVAEEPDLSLRINGMPWDYLRRDNRVEISLSLGPGETADIIFSSTKPDPVSIAHRGGGMYSTRVLVRRLLSEFRDDYVDTSRVLSKVMSGVRKLYQRKKTVEGRGGKTD